MSAPRVVQPGDEMVVAVQGGFVRRPVPGAGLLFGDEETGDTFVALEDVASLVDAAREMPTRKRGAR